MLESNARIRRSCITRGAVSTLHRRTNTPKKLERESLWHSQGTKRPNVFVVIVVVLFCCCVFCFGIKGTEVKGERRILQKN